MEEIAATLSGRDERDRANSMRCFTTNSAELSSQRGLKGLLIPDIELVR